MSTPASQPIRPQSSGCAVQTIIPPLLATTVGSPVAPVSVIVDAEVRDAVIEMRDILRGIAAQGPAAIRKRGCGFRKF